MGSFHELTTRRSGWGHWGNMKEICDEVINKCFETLEKALDATKRVRAGRGAYDDEADHKTRIVSAELLLAYKYGRPTNTSRNLNLNVSDAGKELMDSVAIAQKLIEGGTAPEIIEQLQRKNIKAVEAIDI